MLIVFDLYIMCESSLLCKLVLSPFVCASLRKRSTFLSKKNIKKVLLVLFVCAFKKKVEVDCELLLLKAKTIEERKIVLKF